MSSWPSLRDRRSRPDESSALWSSTVFFLVPGIPVLLLLLLVDPAQIAGEPRWLKPLKFFVSLGIYGLTLEWLYRVFRSDRNIARLNGVRRVVAAGILIEALLIVLQAARGVRSHFNVATALDATIYRAMGVVIAIVVLAVLWSGFEIWRARRRAPRVWSEAAVLAILVTTVGSFQGFTMAVPSPEQESVIAQGGDELVAGSHFVGSVPDDEHDTLPVTGWSAKVGDLRIPHFIGVHALQVFLFIAWLLHRARFAAPLLALRLVALLYVALFAHAFLQAQSGVPFL